MYMKEAYRPVRVRRGGFSLLLCIDKFMVFWNGVENGIRFDRNIFKTAGPMRRKVLVPDPSFEINIRVISCYGIRGHRKHYMKKAR